jgi:hypothetical protein
VPSFLIPQATPLLVGLGIAGAAIVGRFAVQAVKRIRTSGMMKAIGSEAGFEPTMTGKEAALILGVSSDSCLYVVSPF